MFKRFGLILVCLGFSTSMAFAESKTAAKANTATATTSNESLAPVAPEQMRCEKMASTTLAEFKMALVENCNLNKPFSSSLSRVLNDEVYFYCCHKKQ